MPSLEQLRKEEFAEIVERAVTPNWALGIFGQRDPLLVRVLSTNGHQIEFTATHVDVDGDQLVGFGLGKQPIHLPLRSVQTVWRRRAQIGRSVPVWAAPLAGGALAGGLMASRMGAVVGGLLGAIAGAVAAQLLHNSQWMYDWEQLYSDPGAGKR